MATPSAYLADPRPQALEVLIKAVRELSLARDLPAIMAIVRQTARKLTGADGASFVLREGDQCYYADEDAIAPLWKGRRFPMSQCLSGWVMLNRKAAVISDIYRNPPIPADAYRPTFVKSLVIVPIRLEAPAAAIGTYWASPHVPSATEVELLQALADATAVAMENVELYHSLERRVEERTADLAASEQRLRLALDAGGFGAFECELTTGQVRTSPPFNAQFGFDCEFISAAEWLARTHPDDEARVREATRRLRSFCEDFREEYRIILPDSTTRWVRVTARAQRGPEGRVARAYGVTQDITAQHEAEQLAHEARAAAERAAALKSRLLAVASHDVRQPLQTVALLAGTLARMTSDRGMLEVIERQRLALSSVSDLLNTLLDLSRLESGAIQPSIESVSLGVLFERLREELQESARLKSITLVVEPTSLAASSDRHLLRQILQNLLGNAVRYTPEGGRVWLRAKSEAGRVRIEVRDTGVGIEPAALSRIFDDFYQAGGHHGERRGWGLGLSIVKHAASLLRHEVTVQSQPGQGSTFTVLAPAVAAAESDRAAVEAKVAPAPAARAGRAPILLIDDDRAVMQAMRLLLQAEGFDVQCASRPEDVRELLQSPDFRPQLIISDVHLGQRGNGPGIVQLIRSRLHRAVPVIFVSGDTGPRFPGVEQLEAARFMSKPVDAEQLIGAARELIERAAAA